MAMIRPREPNTFTDAIARIIGALTARGAGEVIGKTESLLRAWADPDRGDLPNVAQAVALDRAMVEAGGEAEILRVYRLMIDGVSRDHVPQDLRDRFLTISGAVGDVAGEIRAGLDPAGPGGSALTLAESAAIAGQARDAISVLEALIRDVERVETGPQDRAPLRMVGGERAAP